MAHRRNRSKPFLDDPSDYPEFSLLIKRQGLQHAFKCGLHRHRTAVLVALAACSAALSGAATPSFNSSNAEWVDFLTEGLALDLLARHFEGFGSALACMFPMALLSALVYPLHRLLISPTASSTAPTPPSPSQPPGQPHRPTRTASQAPLSVAIVASTSVLPVWALAVWGSASFDWGLASGMSVGLLGACLSLKSAAFAREWCRSTSLDGLALPPNNSPPRTEKAAVAGGGGVSSPAGEKGDPRKGILTVGEFLFFLLAAPTLVCEPELLKASARRRPRLPHAISEFSHALLAFLALHAACSSLIAPLMRVVATFIFSSPSCLGPSNGGYGSDAAEVSPFGGWFGKGLFSSAATTTWVDCAGWTGSVGGGGGGWFFARLPGGYDRFESLSSCGARTGTASVVSTGTGWLEFLAALTLGMLFSTPLVHSLTFYGFWHCVCLGIAEFWGYPDRNFYGPWWLLSDEPDTMFRLWSAPVHRWLSSCIYRPIVDSEVGPTAGPPSLDPGGDHRYSGVAAPDAGKQAENKQQKQEQQRSREPERWPWRRLLGLLATFVFSSVVHEAVTFVAMRRTCWPFNTFTLVLATVIISGWDTMYPVKSLISEDEDGSKVEEIGGGSSGGFRTSAGVTTAPLSSHPTGTGATTMLSPGLSRAHGDTVPSNTAVRREDVRESNALGGSADRDSDVGGGFGGVPKAGRKWRGYGAVAFFQVASTIMAFIVNFLAWQWWRHTFLGK